MKPAAFDYYRPTTINETLELLTDHGMDGKILAGGQSFVPILNMRMSSPECLIDINHLSDLNYVRMEEGFLKIGSLTRQRELETSKLIQKHVPLLAEAAPFIGHVQTRNRGTIGGSLVHADPSAELPLCFLALDAKMKIRCLDEERQADISDFFVTYLTTDMMPDELLTEILIPINGDKGYAFEEFSRRHGDFAIVAAACLLRTDSQGNIVSGNLVLGGIDAVPVKADKTIDFLIGKSITEDSLQEAVQLSTVDTDPDEDMHASRDYRIHLAQVVAKRAIMKAYERALKKEDNNGKGSERGKNQDTTHY